MLGVITYLCCCIILVYCYCNFSVINDVRKLEYFFLGCGLVPLYGFFQHFGHDPIPWTNPYNPVIATLGNPNFSGAFMSMISIAYLGFGLMYFRLSKVRSGFYLSALLLSILVIYFSNARQGLLSFFIATFVLLTGLLWRYNKKFGVIAIVFGISLFFLVIVALFQKGPLSNLIYKSSISIRGYYFRAAIDMFLSYPLFGVGIDSYGRFFRQFKDLGYVNEYGNLITSTNAHNVPLQFLSTGGLLLVIPYFVLLIMLLIRVLKALPKIEPRRDYYLFLTIFSVWVAYFAQSLISIDMIVLALMNWTMMGILFGLTTRNKDKNISLNRTKSVSENLFAMGAALLIFIFIVVQLQFQNKVLQVTKMYLAKDSRLETTIENLALEINKSSVVLPYQKLESASYLLDTKSTEKGLGLIYKLILDDQRCSDCMQTLANYYEKKTDNYETVIKLRMEIHRLDPHNTDNLFLLARAYKNLRDFSSMAKIRDELLKITTNRELITLIQSELIDK
jgi:O-antigen ligase